MANISHKETLRATLLTPPGEGGISVIYLCGRGAAEFVSGRLAGPSGISRPVASGRLTYGFLCDAQGHRLDEVIVAALDGASVEINCHGGAIPAMRIMKSLAAAGVAVDSGARAEQEAAEPSGGTGRLEAEAFAGLVGARTELAARVFAAQYGGALARALNAALAALEAHPPDARQAREILDRLSATAALGLALSRPRVIAIVGPANAGKSTLVNRLAGYERNIVADLPGTTRDAVHVEAAICGVPVVLVDTAGSGVEAPCDEIAAIARGMAEAAYEKSDLALVVIDASSPAPREPAVTRGGKDAVVSANKCDLGARSETLAEAVSWGLPVVEVSAATGQGIETLSAAILAALGIGGIHGDIALGGVIFSPRQRDAVAAALAALSIGRAGEAGEAIASIFALETFYQPQYVLPRNE